MYNVVLYVHVLALVYWLGGDLGTFLSSRHVLRSELGVESRQTAFNILMECDMGPRLAMPLILGSGFHLSSLRWPGLLPDGTALIGWLVVMVWVALVAAIHSSVGQRVPSDPVGPSLTLCRSRRATGCRWIRFCDRLARMARTQNNDLCDTGRLWHCRAFCTEAFCDRVSRHGH